MNDTINTLRDFWGYFTAKKGYKILVRTVPFVLSVTIILTIMTVYAVYRFDNAFDLGSVPNLDYMTQDQIANYIYGLPVTVLTSIATYVGSISLVLLILSVGIRNSIYNSTKDHVIDSKLPTVANTFSNATRGYGRFTGYMIVYSFLPLVAVIIVLMITGLSRFTFITSIISNLLTFFFYSKLLRIENGDYLIPVAISLLSIALSYLAANVGGIMFILVYLISVIFGFALSMIMVYSLLKDNDFREGLKYE